MLNDFGRIRQVAPRFAKDKAWFRGLCQNASGDCRPSSVSRYMVNVDLIFDSILMIGLYLGYNLGINVSGLTWLKEIDYF